MRYEPITEFSAERCEILARVIEQQPHTDYESKEGFNMSMIRHDCGSPCCIEGFAASMLPSRHVYKAIEQFIGCETEEADMLYSGSFSPHWPHLQRITPAEAAAALRALAAKRQEQQQ
jgi:hypothetical protein